MGEQVGIVLSLRDHSSNSLIFINKNNGWISGLQDIYYSSNGGLNWTTQTTDHLVKYNGIYFIDSLTGWAAGDSGIILKTTTGGVIIGFTNTSANPRKYFLSQNYPNPFNPETVISYELPVTSRTKLKVYDVLGNEIATLVNETKPAGSYNYQFSTVNYQLSSGVYLYRLEIDGNIIDTKRMVLLK
ncbi:MAG: T9SS type A sorting domain-containing protein [Ignavibacteria bacterium]